LVGIGVEEGLSVGTSPTTGFSGSGLGVQVGGIWFAGRAVLVGMVVGMDIGATSCGGLKGLKATYGFDQTVANIPSRTKMPNRVRTERISQMEVFIASGFLNI
jgi:hypothetical protein